MKKYKKENGVTIMNPQDKTGKNAENRDLIIGRNAVIEALRAGRPIDRLLVARGERSGSALKIIAGAKAKGVVIKETDPKKLDFMCGAGNHQGIAAYAAAKEYAEVGDILALAELRGEPPFIIICDELEDPHNLGAVIRTAEAAGAHGVIVPGRRSAPLGTAAAKTAAGALEYIPVARVGNLAAAIDGLKENGVWIYGADPGGKSYTETDFSGAAALVVGAEGRGIGRLVREKCDFLVSLPMRGQIGSLNASVAAGILMYEIARRRDKIIEN